MLLFLPGGGVPHLTRRGGSEVCVVISGQHQGQVYLCDTANLGSSAHSWHPVSEGCPGSVQVKLENKVHVHFGSNTSTMRAVNNSTQKQFVKVKVLSNKSASIWAKKPQGCKRLYFLDNMVVLLLLNVCLVCCQGAGSVGIGNIKQPWRESSSTELWLLPQIGLENFALYKAAH